MSTLPSNEKHLKHLLCRAAGWLAEPEGESFASTHELITMLTDALKAHGNELRERLFFATLPKATPELIAEAIKQGKLPANAHETEAVAALNAIRAKLAEYLERLLQGRALPNRWVGEINEIVSAALAEQPAQKAVACVFREGCKYQPKCADLCQGPL